VARKKDRIISGSRLTVTGNCRITGLDGKGDPFGPITVTDCFDLTISLEVDGIGGYARVLRDERDAARTECVALRDRLRPLEQMRDNLDALKGDLDL
jgi:hypothetical protein